MPKTPAPERPVAVTLHRGSSVVLVCLAGWGLAISRTITERHGGRITVDSQ